MRNLDITCEWSCSARIIKTSLIGSGGPRWESGKVCTHLGGLWRTVVSLIRGVNDMASNNRLKELDLILLPGMDNMVSKCTEGYHEEKVKRSTEFNSDKSQGSDFGGNSI